MKLLVVVVIAWIWWTATIGLASVCPLAVPLEADKHTLGIQTLRFTTAGATPDSYTQLIEALRDQLASGYEVEAIPVMRDPSTVRIAQRFILLELSNSPQVSVTLAIDVTNAYVVAYRAGSRSYFLSDAPQGSQSVLFTDTQQHSLPFDGSYTQLQRNAREDREKIDVGILALEDAIALLYSSSDTQQNRRARSLIISIQMIAEAARFKYIEQLVRASIRRQRSFRPDPGMLSLENNWGRLSRAVQNSNQGVFNNPVRL